ncbi:hypothetical protein NECAME_02418 [Necator americanus]|uniref:Uncharacterized protein n=1 Tax=Necator americanus TaxID=51031 RepID=W2TGJ9_NECAM|nr:hypothetical protein NECAME_02418 [Necator americanus]ETN80286.1 hypothetical protein NECAME_02418 [Necator americanus]
MIHCYFFSSGDGPSSFGFSTASQQSTSGFRTIGAKVKNKVHNVLDRLLENSPLIPTFSPESVAASPMLISSRTSECGDPPIESDEGYGISDSGETSRRSTISRMDMVELSRDLEVKNKYPELYQMIIAQRRFGSAENREAAVVVHNTSREASKEDDSKQLLYVEAVELLKRCRRQERQLREMQKSYDNLLSVNKQIKETYVKIYAKAEQEEEYISNILLKRIQKLKNDKETLAQKYEQEEEFLTNDLMRKIKQSFIIMDLNYSIALPMRAKNHRIDTAKHENPRTIHRSAWILPKHPFALLVRESSSHALAPSKNRARPGTAMVSISSTLSLILPIFGAVQLQSERDILEGNVKSEQASVIDSLLTTIRRMESEMAAGRKNMDRMRKEKIDQENALEHEQELLFNTLGKQMDQLNQEKRKMQASLQKAYLNGFIEPDDEVVGSLVNQGESNDNMRMDSGSRGGSEVARLRSHLRRVEHQLAEMREREANKAAQIRQLEDVISTLRKEKNEMSRNIEVAVSRFSTKMDSMTSLIRPDLMGPPCVPQHSSSRHADGNDSEPSSFDLP